MEDLMLLKYLKDKGMDNLSEKEFREFIMRVDKEKDSNKIFKEDYYDSFQDYKRHYYNKPTEDYEHLRDKKDSKEENLYRRYMNYFLNKEEENTDSEHFNESYAKYLVSNMSHREGGKKHTGEKYSMEVAKDVCDRYRGTLPQGTTIADIYIAINCQYHNYKSLFRMWFGENIDSKIIESAIFYWFKNDDDNTSKLWDHFKDK